MVQLPAGPVCCGGLDGSLTFPSDGAHIASVARASRILAIAILIAASLNATAGLCFCNRGPDTPASRPAGHACCHGLDTTGTLALRAVASCCHIEDAVREMTPVHVIQFVPPVATVVDRLFPAGETVLLQSFAQAFAPSPPVQVLRL